MQVLFLWLDRGVFAEELLPIIVFNGLVIPFLLAFIHLLDHQSVVAIDAMKPMLEMTKKEFDTFRYILSNMPSRPMLIAGLSLLCLVILMEQLWIEPVRYVALEQLPVFTIVYQLIDKSSAFLFGVLIYHTIRQLGLVNTIHSNYLHIDVYNFGSLKAFSKLTASTAVGLVIGVYGWMLINPDLLADPISFGFAMSATVLAVAVFVWPLWGVHRRMEMEKESVLHDIDLRLVALFSKFNQQFREDNYSTVETLNGAISSLDIQRRMIGAVPTWPWSPETGQFVLAAIALPLVLMVFGLLIEFALGI